MSNFSPDPENSRDLVPLDNSEILPVFISSQANGLFDAKDPKVQKEILENIEKAIELSKRLKDMQAEETIRPIELERKKSAAQLEIAENRYKILSLKVKKTLGIASIPISLAFGLYSYVILNKPSQGVFMIIFGLGGALLTYFKERPKLSDFLFDNPKDNSK
jgi:hypothetical protein